MPASINRFIILTAFSLLLLSAAKAQSFTWAQAINAANAPNGKGVTKGITNTAGNLYTVGLFSGTANFVGMPLTAVSNGDMFAMKEDPSGNFIWAKLIRGDNAKQPYFLAFNSAFNVFVSGRFLGPADFNPSPGIHTLTDIPG